MKTVITARPSLKRTVQEVIIKRDILFLLTKREIYLRYKYKTIGVLWGLAQPLLLAFVISQSLGKTFITSLPAAQYFLSIFVGYFFWLYFSTTLSKITVSLFSNRFLIKNAPFPHIVLPFSTLGVGAIDFFLACIAAFLFTVYFHFPTMSFLLLFLPILIMLLTTIGLGAFFSILYTKYSDVRELLSFTITLLFYITPIIYPIRFIPYSLHPYIYLNPMAGVIEIAKAIFFDPSLFSPQAILISLGSSMVLFICGIWFFIHFDSDIADIV